MYLSRAISEPLRAAISGNVDKKALGLALYLILGAAVLAPLLEAEVPPLVDYPDHLARMWILVNGTAIPDLARNYVVHWRVLPDLAMDLVVPLLSLAMPVERAGRIFIALTMLALIGGTVTLHRVLHGRVGIWPICSVLFVYNAALFWGFLNCLFATGIYLFAFSGWIATRYWRAAPRILAFSAVASLLLLLHLFAFGLYGLSVIAYELANRAELRRMSLRSLATDAAVCLQFAPGVMLCYASLPDSGSAATANGDLASKLYALISPFIFSNPPVLFDRLAAPLMTALLALAIISRALKLAPDMRLPLAAMIVVALLMPNWIGGWLADIRLPVALPFVIIASTRFEASRKLATPIAAAALLVVSLRVWSVSQAWRDYDRWFAEFRTASAVIAPGARLLVVEAPVPDEKRKLPGVPESLANVQWITFTHMAALAVIDRAAFFPYIFTGWTTVDVAPRNKVVSQREGAPMTPEAFIESANPEQATSLDTGPDSGGERPYWRNWPETFDFVLWIDFAKGPKPELKQLQPLANGSFFDIYRVVGPRADRALRSGGGPHPTNFGRSRDE